MKTFLKTFIRDESGASAAEYALIIAVVGVGIGAAALVLGQNVQTAVGNAANDVAECANADTGYSEEGTPYTGQDCETAAGAGGGGGTSAP